MAHDAEYERLVAEFTEAGLLESYVDENGQPAMRLTEKGAATGRALVMRMRMRTRCWSSC